MFKAFIDSLISVFSDIPDTFVSCAHDVLSFNEELLEQYKIRDLKRLNLIDFLDAFDNHLTDLHVTIACPIKQSHHRDELFPSSLWLLFKGLYDCLD